jgi:hypothetical protein|nr:MAG TPA: hypothetical protein [Inoviridae sp.]
MKTLRRVVSLFLVTVLLLSFPLTAFAAPAAVPSVSEYIFDTLLSANGVDTSLSGVQSWLGSWTGYDDYLEQGKRGELGSYSQWLYDRQYNGENAEIKAKAREQIDAMTDWMNMDWADVGGKDITLGTGILNGWVDGVKGTTADYATSIKGYLSSFASYGSDALDYIKEIASVNDSIKGWTKPSNFGKCFLTYSEPGFLSYEVDYKWLFLPANFNELNIPYAYLDFYKATEGKYYVKFKYLSNVAPTIGKSYGLNLYVHSQTLDTKTGKISMNDSSVSTNDGRYLTAAQIKSIPFPVFSNEAAANSFVANRTMENLLNQEAFGMPVVAVNQQAQTMEPKVVPTVITLPQTGELAAQLMDELSDAMDRIEELEAALKNAGFAIDWGADVVVPTVAPTDVPVEGEDTETKTTLAAILAKVEAIPATIEAMLNNKLEPGDTDEDVENMKLPTSIADKFPFCIPFDVIYLVKAMNASSEVPRFELPFKIHYQNINYEHTFIVDMTEWDTAVKILRTMLDLLFIASLISSTRELIRG